MPKRTNDFQQLVHMVQRALAPVGARVTESAMVPGQGTNREIDVLIESHVGPYRIKIAVEAKDETRRFDVDRLEAILGRYLSPGGIPVNKVVVVTRNGFTDGARKRAEESSVELFTLDQVIQSDWTKLVPQQLVVRIPPHIDRVEIVPEPPRTRQGDPLADGRIVCDCHGHDYGSPNKWAEWFYRTQMLPNEKLTQYIEEEAKRRNGQCGGPVSWPFPNHKLLFRGRKYPISELRFHLHCVYGSAPVAWSSHAYKGCAPPSAALTVDQMEAIIGGKRIRTLFPSGPTSERVVLRVDPAPANQGVATPDPPPRTFVSETLPAPYCPVHMPSAGTGRTSAPPSKPAAHKKAPITNSSERVGRNASCPCGSGKKFKHCCMKK